MCSAKKKEVVNVNHPIQPPKIPLFQDSFKVFKVLDTWNIHELKRYAYYIVRWLQIMKFMKNGHVSFYPVILRIQTGSSNFRSSFRILKIPMENSGGSPLARFPPRTQALTASTIASLSASSWMPKPPEKSRKLCDVWSFFPPCPGLFWGLKFLCWNFCWTTHLIHGFTISKLTRGLIPFSPASNNIHYSVSSSKKNDFSTLFTQLHVFSREPLRGPPTNHFPYMKGY